MYEPMFGLVKAELILKLETISTSRPLQNQQQALPGKERGGNGKRGEGRKRERSNRWKERAMRG